eukprot:m.121482 g.121482  ORF g.121482 m.121482 type:complete len:461 (+) comp12921_c7_seq22:40-1422(+)
MMNVLEGSGIPENDNLIVRALSVHNDLLQKAREESENVTQMGITVELGGELVKPTARPSWRTLLQSPLGAFLTGVKPRATFIQLTGHKGDFASAQGVLFKKSSDLEKAAYEDVSEDPILKAFVPMYFSTVQLRNEENEPVEFLQLQDLLCFYDCPSIMDVKMGIRTFQEQEITKTKRRKDLLAKMMKLDPDEPTIEEKEHGITKARYMIFRERLSSTNTLGLRVEAIKRFEEDPQMGFQRVRDVEAVKNALALFFPDPHTNEEEEEEDEDEDEDDDDDRDEDGPDDCNSERRKRKNANNSTTTSAHTTTTALTSSSSTSTTTAPLSRRRLSSGSLLSTDRIPTRKRTDKKKLTHAHEHGQGLSRKSVLMGLLTKLKKLKSCLKASSFFKTHELIGSSLLFIYDKNGKTGVYMIDFGKTSRCEHELRHDVRWQFGTQEDGYLIGLNNLILQFNELLHECNA